MHIAFGVARQAFTVAQAHVMAHGTESMGDIAELAVRKNMLVRGHMLSTSDEPRCDQ